MPKRLIVSNRWIARQAIRCEYTKFLARNVKSPHCREGNKRSNRYLKTHFAKRHGRSPGARSRSQFE
jgi:hypothetical protein